MRVRRLGRTGWPVSEVGYGMWGLAAWTGADDDETRRSLDRAVELGCTFFDSAWSYGAGRSERLLGELVARHRGRRLLVATKIPPKTMRWPASRTDALADVFPPDHMREYTERSLENLRVDAIDLQQLHVWSDHWADDAAWDDWQGAIAALKREGLVRAFGISVGRWQPASVLRALETGLIDAVQVAYNLFDQSPEDALFPACERLDVGVIARTPFDEGSLTGTLTSDSTWPEDDFRHGYFSAENLAATLPRVDAVRADLPEGMTLPELALRFILHHPAVSTVIPGMRKLAHVERNLAVSDGTALPASRLLALRAHRWDRKPKAT